MSKEMYRRANEIKLILNQILYGITSQTKFVSRMKKVIKLLDEMIEETSPRKFRLYWGNGTTEIVEGVTIRDAFAHAGYGGGVLTALVTYHEGEAMEYSYIPDRSGKLNWMLIDQ